jgi:hypothetical protein
MKSLILIAIALSPIIIFMIGLVASKIEMYWERKTGRW